MIRIRNPKTDYNTAVLYKKEYAWTASNVNVNARYNNR
jgi:hypothetical protein